MITATVDHSSIANPTPPAATNVQVHSQTDAYLMGQA
jgi:hypothetical protein